MRLKRLIGPLFASMYAAAAVAAAQGDESSAREEGQSPPESVEAEPADAIRHFDLDTISDLGVRLHLVDGFAARATDIMLEQRLDLDSYPLRGWVVTGEGDDVLVTFVGEFEGEYRALFEVFPERRRNRFVDAKARELTAEEALRFRVRSTAIAGLTDLCSSRYNTVVLRDPESDGWLAYLLAATTNYGEIVVGGHYRFSVSADGSTILGADRLSRSCLTIDSSLIDSSSETVAINVSHIVSNTPVETHVFVSLLHSMPVYVVTDDGTMWRVAGSQIGHLPAE